MIRKQDYFKSPEGVKEFEKLNLTYEDEMWDDAYDAFLKLTKRTPEKEVEREIHNMVRVVLPNGKQYIIWQKQEQIWQKQEQIWQKQERILSVTSKSFTETV